MAQPIIKKSAVQRAADWLRRYADNIVEEDPKAAFEAITLSDDLEHEEGLETLEEHCHCPGREHLKCLSNPTCPYRTAKV